jgi:20S proteasome alpha/beta subunit
VDVKVAAQLVKQMAYSNKSNLQAGMIVAGWSATEGGVVYGIPLGGTLLQLPFTLGGSGSTYIYGWVDSMWRPGMTRAQAEAFVAKAVSLAMARDGSSGGVIRMVTIDAKGVTRTVRNGYRGSFARADECPRYPSAARAGQRRARWVRRAAGRCAAVSGAGQLGESTHRHARRCI